MQNRVPQAYFEMADIRPVQSLSWIPLRCDHAWEERAPVEGVQTLRGYTGIASLAVYPGQRDPAERLGWSELGTGAHRSHVWEDEYYPADQYLDRRFEGPVGVNLVIDQDLEEDGGRIWHLHPDLVVALRLIREGDSWFRPKEGWALIARLNRDDAGRPRRLEIRQEFLGDYLSARGMALRLSSYIDRVAITADKPSFGWSKDRAKRGRDAGDELELRIDDAGFAEPDGYYRTSGALWRTEWFEPGELSERVRGDDNPNPVTFTASADGARKTPDALRGSMSWLYFDPSLALDVWRHRSGGVGWYTRDTGWIGAAAEPLHFGVNSNGLINIFAKDIGKLDAWEQRLWSAKNVTPDGGVSDELLAAQMDCKPASTKAPESLLESALVQLNAVFQARFGRPLLRESSDVQALIRRSHRFRACESEGLLSLSKDLTRLLAERVDVAAISAAISEDLAKSSSLKALEKLLATTQGVASARAAMAPLFGIHDLRIADAHLGSSKIESGLQRAEVDQKASLPEQGRQLLVGFLKPIEAITEALKA